MKKAFLKNFAIFTGKLQACNFIKNGLRYRCFPMNIAKFLRTPILKDICSVSSCFCVNFFVIILLIIVLRLFSFTKKGVSGIKQKK